MGAKDILVFATSLGLNSHLIISVNVVWLDIVLFDGFTQ